MKRTLPLSALASLLVLVAGAAELTNDYPVTTYDTVVPGDTNQPVAFGEHVAVSETDATDLETHVNDRAPDCTNGQIRQRGSSTWSCIATPSGGGTPAANSITAAQAQANTEAQRRNWSNRLQIGDDWSDIPNGTAIQIGKVVEHGGAYFGAITNHSKGNVGPDGDPTNWTLLSNFYGAWSAAWYPAGSFVVHANLPYVATSAVVNTDPAPNAATNTKWLQLGSLPTSVVIASSNTSIPASARDNTYMHTGSSNITYTLPRASGSGAVDNGWEVVITNQGAGDLTIDGFGSDTVDGSATLVINTNGRSLRLQKVANTSWVTIADTLTGGDPFTPSKSNIYDAVKAILVHNTAVTADDANDELDIATGQATTIADNSIAPIKAQAGTAAQQKAWRSRLASSSIGLVASALPAVAGHNTGDTIIVGRGGTTTVAFREVDTPSTELTTTVAGDVMMLLSAGWSRIGNLFSGGIAAQAAQTTANAAKAVTDRLDVFGTAELSPPGIPDRAFPEFMALRLDNRITDQTIIEIRVLIEDSPIATVNTTAALAPFNRFTAIEDEAVGPTGGIINIALNSSTRQNLLDGISSAAQYTRLDIHYKFTGTSLATNVPADAIDRIHFGVNNNGYPASGGGLTQSQVDARVLALRTLVPTFATPATGDRLFFTDENQSGDPLRVTQVGTLATAMGVPSAAVVARIPKAPVVLQAAVNGGDTAGVTSITLPANYATYRGIGLTAWERNEDRIVTGSLQTAMLSAQTANRVIVIAGNPTGNAGARVTLNWNPTTRALGLAQQDRIIHALLHD